MEYGITQQRADERSPERRGLRAQELRRTHLHREGLGLTGPSHGPLNQRSPNKYRFKTAGFLKSPSRLEENHLTSYGSTKAVTPPWNNRDPRK